MKNKINIQKSLIFFIFIAFISCKETNWQENYREKSKSPFGTYVVFNEANNLFKNEVHYLRENIYDYFFHNYNGNSDFENYICIKNFADKFSDDSLKDLLSFVADGNQAFFSLNYFNNKLKENLDFETIDLDSTVFSIQDLKKLDGELTLTETTYEDEKFFFDRNIRKNYITKYNQNNTIILGNIEVNGEKKPNFIKVYYGKGAVYIHTNPIVFTNYYLLKDKEEYVENVLSYLPKREILWDPQFRFSRFSGEDDETSVFSFFLQYETLTWFLIVSFSGLLLFMLFNAKRKQRAIPVVKPLKNSTVKFSKTIANLYLKEANHKNLVDKKITFFLEKIRIKYLIDTSNLNSKFIEKLALKSGNNLQKTNYLINTIITLNKRSECSDSELIVLNKMIKKFLK